MANTSSNPLDRDADIAIGITLPLRKGPSGFFEQSYKTIDQVKSNIKNLLFTKKGERIMQPDFGADLYKLAFEQNTDSLEVSIKDSITYAIATWLPYVTIENLIIRRDLVNIDTYTIEIQMDFTIINDPTSLESLTLTVQV